MTEKQFHCQLGDLNLTEHVTEITIESEPNQWISRITEKQITKALTKIYSEIEKDLQYLLNLPSTINKIITYHELVCKRNNRQTKPIRRKNKNIKTHTKNLQKIQHPIKRSTRCPGRIYHI